MKNSTYAILYVDDELNSLKYFSREFSKDFTVLTASNAEEAWHIIEQHHNEIGVLLTDQRMPETTGVQLLENVRALYPRMIRILVTAYADLDDAIKAVNTGAIYKYISKPWDVPDLRVTLLRALEFYHVHLERDQLLNEKLSTLQHIILTDRVKNFSLLTAGLSPALRNHFAAVEDFFEQLPDIQRERGPAGPTAMGFGRDIAVFMSEESDRVFELFSTIGDITSGQSAATENHPSLEYVTNALTNRMERLTIDLKGTDRVQLDWNPHYIATLLERLASTIQKIARGPVAIQINEYHQNADSQIDRIVSLLGGLWEATEQTQPTQREPPSIFRK